MFGAQVLGSVAAGIAFALYLFRGAPLQVWPWIGTPCALSDEIRRGKVMRKAMGLRARKYTPSHREASTTPRMIEHPVPALQLGALRPYWRRGALGDHAWGRRRMA